MTDSGEQQEGVPVGSILDALGVQFGQQPGDLVSSATVLLSVTGEDGRTRLSVLYSEGQDWLTRIGMLNVALDQEMPPR